ncbi:unnamed protein product [Polarella glacialis]|uniref:Uncharacterized protein n=1 Tax=Polarella glacialis TaxID=89957 RepID=A0A813KNT0_POLGL|nr:unnamed protein product [Polarella glacialis]
MPRQVLLRQVFQNHGHCIPPFRFGKVRDWLQLLPSDELVKAMDRSTVVLPKGGDGSYAPPGAGGAEAALGFPWGELSEQGVQDLRRAGSALVPSGALGTSPGSCWDASQVFVRAANRRRSIVSAQALALGAMEALRSKDVPPGQSRGVLSPVEVLVQAGEDLLPVTSPGAPGFPGLGHGSTGGLEAELSRLAGIAEFPCLADFLSKLGYEGLEASKEPDSWDPLCEALLSLDGMVSLSPPMAEKAAAVKRLNFLHWTAPLQATGTEAAYAIIGPLLRELFRACEATIEGETKESDANFRGGSNPSMIIYSAEASSLAMLEGSFSLAMEAFEPEQTWPALASSLEVQLLEVDGRHCLHFLRNGQAVMPGVVPYEEFSARLSLERPNQL